MRHRMVIAFTGLAFAALPALAEPKLVVDPDLARSDVALLQDEAKATAELQHRLRDQVTNRDGLLVIIDRSGTSSGVTAGSRSPSARAAATPITASSCS
jgi:hypothetical protein